MTWPSFVVDNLQWLLITIGFTGLFLDLLFRAAAHSRMAKCSHTVALGVFAWMFIYGMTVEIHRYRFFHPVALGCTALCALAAGIAVYRTMTFRYEFEIE